VNKFMTHRPIGSEIRLCDVFPRTHLCQALDSINIPPCRSVNLLTSVRTLSDDHAGMRNRKLATACADLCTQETTSSTARSDCAKWTSTSI
jgi:hypothetical protein